MTVLNEIKLACRQIVPRLPKWDSTSFQLLGCPLADTASVKDSMNSQIWSMVLSLLTTMDGGVVQNDISLQPLETHFLQIMQSKR